MKFSVFGLGHTGTVTAACTASAGHDVIGVDPAVDRVAAVNAGRSPIQEPGLDELVAEQVRAGNLRATSLAREGVEESDAAVICVGTPSDEDGAFDLSYLTHACDDIGSALVGRPGPFTVIIRSTVLPGTTESVAVPLLQARSGRRLGEDLSVSVMPEFLREGTALDDFASPARVVIGALDDRGYQAALTASCAESAPVFRLPLGVAELVKYVDNTWHALKVAFANEIGAIAREHDLDGQQVMEVFCSDDKANLSRSYLRPGAPFGGSCLPKDVRALSRRAQGRKLDLPLLNSILTSNDRHLDRFYEAVVGHGSKRIGVLGLAFKQRTGDLRQSPVVTLVQRLLAMGFDVRAHEPGLLSGADVPNHGLPLGKPGFLVDSVDEVFKHAETVVIGTGWTMTDEVAERLRSAGLPVVSMAS